MTKNSTAGLLNTICNVNPENWLFNLNSFFQYSDITEEEISFRIDLFFDSRDVFSQQMFAWAKLTKRSMLPWNPRWS